MFLWSIRSNAERSLFAKAGVDVDGAAIVHFYDAKLQAQLEKTETAYRAISASDIRRTYFNVQKDGQGYRFIVTSQSFLR